MVVVVSMTLIFTVAQLLSVQALVLVALLFCCARALCWFMRVVSTCCSPCLLCSLVAWYFSRPGAVGLRACSQLYPAALGGHMVEYQLLFSTVWHTCVHTTWHSDGWLSSAGQGQEREAFFGQQDCVVLLQQ
jgi:hypothetical protein